jgi:hypothetical protein
VRAVKNGYLWLCVFSAACQAAPEHVVEAWQPAFDAGALWLVDVTATPDGAHWWAVGGTEDQGAIFEGAREFTPVELEQLPLLHWAHAFAADDVFVVGKRGTVLRFDGRDWSRQDAPSTQDLWGVWGAAPDDVWAVGGDGLSEGHATLLHWDGAGWSEVDQPALARPHVWAWYKVWGSSARDVYVVGQSGGALHYDGSAWRELALGTAEDLIAVWGTGPDRVAVVGGRSSALLATFDGARWNTESLAPLPGLNGIWFEASGPLHVAGIEGTLAHVDFDTHAYTVEPLDAPTRLVFHALHGAGGRLLAVGGNLGSSVPPYRSIARERRVEP